MKTCFFDYGYPKNFNEVELMLKNIKHGSSEQALKMYLKTGFFDVPSLYESILYEEIKKGKVEIGYLYLPPYIQDLKNCEVYVSLIPFISKSTEMYLKTMNIKKVEELGQSDKFLQVWGDKINKKYPFEDNVFLIFHSAPLTDHNYKNKINKFKKRLEELTNIKLHTCYISYREGWLGPPLSECYSYAKIFAITGFLFENAELLNEIQGIKKEFLKLDMNDVKSLLYEYL